MYTNYKYYEKIIKSINFVIPFRRDSNVFWNRICEGSSAEEASSVGMLYNVAKKKVGRLYNATHEWAGRLYNANQEGVDRLYNMA
jgi:hypothetical protein